MAVRGFAYQPRAEGDNGTVAEYEFFGSNDGTDWRRLAGGTFAGIAEAHTTQVVTWAEAATVRFVRFVATREVRGRAWASCAELSILAR